MSNSSPQTLAVAGLYAALMSRAPDADGFAFWMQASNGGVSMPVLAQTFLGTPEGISNFPLGQTGEQFVTSFYTSVFGRAPDTGGLAFWTAALAAQGGTASLEARASLVTQILSIVNTQLTTRPEGLSEAAYAQTVADRARFINKAEFGVYFATELRSNDLAMAKAAQALITDNPASLAAARDFPVTGGVPPTPTLAISSADAAADITSKFAAYPATIATVDATNMSAAQQVAVADAVAKIAAGGISKLSLVLGDALVTDAVTSALLGKATGATVDASGATPIEVAALIGSLANIAADGIGGALPLDGTIADADIATLFAKYSGTTALVNASGMSGAQLAAVAAVESKLAAGGISGLSLALNAVELTDAVSIALLAKATAASVDASGATDAEIAALVTSITNIAANGITGTLALASTTTATDITALMGKYAGSTATINAADMTTAQQAAVAAAAPTKVAAGGIANLSLVLNEVLVSDAVTTALLAKATGATVDASGATSNEVMALAGSLANIATNGISGALPIDSTIAATAIPDLFDKYAGTTAVVNASGMTGAQLAAVAGVAPKLAAGGLSNLSLPLGNSDVTDTVSATLLAIASGASVDATGATATELAGLVTALGNVAANGITGALALTNVTTATDIANLLAKYAGTTALVNASGMDTAQLQAVAAASTKIATNGITNLALNQTTLTLDDTQATALLAKATGASFDATSASASRLMLVGDNIIGVADNGITGSATLTSAMTVAQLAALLGPKMTVAATVQIDAATMSMAQLAVVGENPTKIDGLSNLPTLDLGNASITAGVATELLSRVTDASVLATGASTANIDVLFAQLAKIAALGISGVLPLSTAQFAATSAAALEPKLAAGASLSVTGTGSDDTFDISAYTHGITVNGGAGQDTLVVTGSTVLGAGAGAANFTGIETLLLKGAATAYLSKIASVENVSLDASTGVIEVREITSAQAQNLKILGGTGSSISLYLNGAAVSAADVVKATVSTTNISGNAQAINLTGITLPDVETLELSGNGGGASGMLTLGTANAQALTTIKVSNAGGATVTVDAGHTGTNLVIDARGSGTATLDASAYAQASGATLYAGSSGGRLVGSAHADTIVGGAGDDIIVGDGVYVGSKNVAEVQTLKLSGQMLTGGTYTLGGFQGDFNTFSAVSLAGHVMGNGNEAAIRSGWPIANVSATYTAEPVFTITYELTAGDVAPLPHSFTGTGLTTGAAVEVVKGSVAVDFVGTVTAAASDTLTGGGGKNTFVFAKNSSTVSAFDTITDLNLGDGTAGGVVDKLLFQTSATTASVAVLDVGQLGQLAAAETLADAVSLALGMAPTAGTAMLFARGTDQFLLFNGDGNTSFDNTADFIIKVVASGVLDVSDIMLVA